MKACKKCGIDHDSPGGERQAALVLACVLGGEFDFVTRDGPVPMGHKDAGIA